jgi:predicted peptidase
MKIRFPLLMLTFFTVAPVLWVFTESQLLSSAFAEEQEVKGTPAAGQQVEMAFTTSTGATIDYLLYLPPGYDGQQQLPLMLFLHGRGESNGPLSLVAKWGPPQLVAGGDELPYILVSPQCPKADRWNSATQQAQLIELLNAVTETWKADPDRIYLTGLSLGGYGSWRLAADHPDRFAAVVPICGGTTPEDAEALKNVPIWAWHGDQDGVVPIKQTAAIVAAIRAAGGTAVRFTTLEGVGHNSWSSAYATPDLYTWINKQRLSQR